MHIPDAFIPISQGLIYWIIALGFIALSVRWARYELSEEKIPLIAVLAAGIFAIQTLNMALPTVFVSGVSGHVVGAALVAIVLGSPLAAVFVMTLVLLLQAIMFGDGGITVMGANIINMGVLGGFFGFYSFRSLNTFIKNRFISAAIAGWISLFIPAIACAVELAVAGTFPITTGLILIGTYHAVAGIIEGGATAVALTFIGSVRPDIIHDTNAGRSPAKITNALIGAGIFFVLILSIASPFIASTNPDGLESAFYRIYGASSAENPSVDQNAVAAADETVAERSGNTFSWAAPFSSYQIPGFDKPGEVLAIIIGIVVILLGAYGTMRFVNRQQ